MLMSLVRSDPFQTNMTCKQFCGSMVWFVSAFGDMFLEAIVLGENHQFFALKTPTFGYGCVRNKTLKRIERSNEKYEDSKSILDSSRNPPSAI